MSWLRTLPAFTHLGLAELRHVAAIAVVALIAWSVPAHAAADGQVNVNTADAPTIARALSGVGVAKANAIVRYREENGRFDTPMDLTKVKGIGAAIVARNEDKIVVSGDATDASTTNQPEAGQ